MPQYKYLIIGGGLAAATAIAGIREVDHAGTIGIDWCRTASSV